MHDHCAHLQLSLVAQHHIVSDVLPLQDVGRYGASILLWCLHTATINESWICKLNATQLIAASPYQPSIPPTFRSG